MQKSISDTDMLMVLLLLNSNAMPEARSQNPGCHSQDANRQYVGGKAGDGLEELKSESEARHTYLIAYKICR